MRTPAAFPSQSGERRVLFTVVIQYVAAHKMPSGTAWVLGTQSPHLASKKAQKKATILIFYASRNTHLPMHH
jgi:hypothetical protein